MRIKVLSLFVTIQVLSFGVWTSLSRAETTENQWGSALPAHPVSEPVLMAETEVFSQEHTVSFFSRNMNEKSDYVHSIKKNQIETVLKKLPSEHIQSIREITLDYNPAMNRGLGGNYRIILRGVNMGVAEMAAVLIHEVAHNVDYGYLVSGEKRIASSFADGSVILYESDPSLDFYRISWESERKPKKTSVSADFVSGYAMSDCFEDFAESYTYYVLHNKDFKRLAASSAVLYEKYHFMKYEVFDGMEFDTGDGMVELNGRPWDITVLDYNINAFLG